MVELIYKDESYKIVGACMEVHNELGKGHSENIYKDYLAASKLKLGLLLNFGEDKLKYERVIL